MCGISGFCDFSKNFKKEPVLWERILTDMHHALAHRGSDSFGTYLDTHVGLSHARLSIRDIAGGSQPMIRQDEGRTCAIVYNGEIYNTDELLPPLLAACSRGDGESLAHAAGTAVRRGGRGVSAARSGEA